MKWLDMDVMKAFSYADLALFIYSNMQRTSQQGENNKDW